MSDHAHHHDHHAHAHQHQHGHVHGHGHGGGAEAFAEANKAHFDATAKDEVDPKWIEMAKMSADAIRAHHALDEGKTVLMDFACHIGLTSREIAPYVKTLVGVDISQGSVDAFNEYAEKQGIPPAKMRAVCVELKGVPGELDGVQFDVITCVAAYHHFADIDGITRVLVHFLKPGGALLVVDISHPEPEASSDGSSSSGHGHAAPLVDAEYAHVVPHTHGMSRDAVQGALERAGLTAFEHKNIGTIEIREKKVGMFIASGVKPAE